MADGQHINLSKNDIPMKLCCKAMCGRSRTETTSKQLYNSMVSHAVNPVTHLKYITQGFSLEDRKQS